MPRIIIASTSETTREQLSRLLTSSGYTLPRSCSSAGELRRVLALCEDGILILAGTMPGLDPEDLVFDYGEHILVLLIAKPDVLSDCESVRVFRLPLPTSGQAIMGAVEMLSQMMASRLPRRLGGDRETVEQAKRLLMDRYGISESDAHRRIQRYAMNHGMRMVDCAAEILGTSGGSK